MGKVTDALSPGLEKQGYEAPDLEWLKQVLGVLESVDVGRGPHQVVKPLPIGRLTHAGADALPSGLLYGHQVFTDDVIVEEVPKVLRELELVKKDLDDAIEALSQAWGQGAVPEALLNRLMDNRQAREEVRGG